jgi:hypothetical protein
MFLRAKVGDGETAARVPLRRKTPKSAEKPIQRITMIAFENFSL